MNGIITDIQRFSLHDGPGIRTTVFFKGCPLRCFWCHNPETGSPQPQVELIKNRCVLCGACAAVCPKGLHSVAETHRFNSTGCIACFECVKACRFSALEITGKRVSVDEIIATALSDIAFYGDNGGITLSGGEPTAQKEFCLELLKAAKAAGLNTCMQTCGCFTPEYFALIRPYLDHVQLDIKDSDPERHLHNTGMPLSQALSTLHLLDESGISYEARSILLSGVNDTEENINGLRAIKATVKNCREWKLFSYHPLGNSKLEGIGKTPLATDYAVPAERLSKLREAFNK